MELQPLVELQLIILLLLISGLILSWRGVLDRAARKGLNTLLLHFLLPCSIVSSFIREFNADIMKSCAWILLASFAVQMISGLLGRFCYLKSEGAHRAVLRYATLVSNAGFIGIPVAKNIFGSIGVLYASMYLIPQRIVMWSAGVSLFEENRSGAWKRVITHPCMIAVLIGLPLMVFQIPVPAFLHTMLNTCGDCTSALSMIVIGAELYGQKPRDMLSPETLWYSTVRLLMIPVVMFFLCRILRFDLTVTGVAVLLSGMPAASTTVSVSQEHGADTAFAARVVCVSTFFSLITIPLVMWGLVR